MNQIAIKRFKSPHQYFLLLNQCFPVKYEIYNQTVASKEKEAEVTVIQNLKLNIEIEKKEGKKKKTKKEGEKQIPSEQKKKKKKGPSFKLIRNNSRIFKQ